MSGFPFRSTQVLHNAMVEKLVAGRSKMGRPSGESTNQITGLLNTAVRKSCIPVLRRVDIHKYKNIIVLFTGRSLSLIFVFVELHLNPLVMPLRTDIRLPEGLGLGFVKTSSNLPSSETLAPYFKMRLTTSVSFLCEMDIRYSNDGLLTDVESGSQSFNANSFSLPDGRTLFQR